MTEKESKQFTDKFDRRNFFKKTGKGVGIALGVSIVNTLPVKFASAQANNLSYPFTLGIASGDPLPDSVVLWTRLAPDPLNGGGMSNNPFPVQW
jgi:alkaline phosphatase D